MKNGTLRGGAVKAAVILTGLLFSHVSMAQSEWKSEKDADGIKIYTRVVADSPLKEFKGEVDIATTPERVVKALKDANSFRKWMPDVASSELLKSSDSDQYHYLENAVPWPLAKRDGVYHFTYVNSIEGGVPVVTVRVEALPDYVPKKDGRVRIPRSDGFWKIVPTTSGANITWQIHADPGGAIPTWLVNSTVVDTPFKMLKGLRGLLESPNSQ